MRTFLNGSLERGKFYLQHSQANFIGFRKQNGTSISVDRNFIEEKEKRKWVEGAVSCRFYSRPNGTEGALMKCASRTAFGQ